MEKIKEIQQIHVKDQEFADLVLKSLENTSFFVEVLGHDGKLIYIRVFEKTQ